MNFSGRIHFADRVMASTRLEVVNSLNNAIDACDEGIMIKDPDSVYKPGARTKAGWIKIKPEYQKDLTDTCDLVILGGRVSKRMSFEQYKNFVYFCRFAP